MKRILFVDDEQVLLDGLRRMLRPLRVDWELVFESSPQAALSRLEQEHFDVVVTDMRMPLLDGVAVLTHVKQLRPEIIRIVLTGQSDLSSSTGAVPVAHRFLAKPCDPETLRDAIERIGRMQALLFDPDMRARVAGIGELPAVPQVCQELAATLSRANYTVAEVAAIAQKDPAVSAKILQIVNSSFFGLGRRVTYMHDAVAYLGTIVLKNLVNAAALWRSLEHRDPAVRERQVRLQEHSLRVAALSRRLLGDKGLAAEEAFMAGLLHDVGELVLLAHFPERVAELDARVGASGQARHELERSMYGVDHGEVGAYLLEAWGLPFPVLESAAYHHRADQLGHSALEAADAVHMANVLLDAREANMDPSSAIDSAYLERIGEARNLSRWAAWAREV